ncbi:MAG: hypothetical protein M1831_006083 [Alyxoria varia]|nr:MAG: hypothetical protein M1831_006083 [Alyxoria varia]
MEERKRPAQDESDRSSHPSKKQAVNMNGANHADADMSWKDFDLQTFQKDALVRQMREYKREIGVLEGDLKDVNSRSKHHDKFLRQVDSFLMSLIKQEAFLTGQEESIPDPPFTLFDPSQHFSAPDSFEEHLRNKAEEIRSIIQKLADNLPSSTSPDASELRKKVSELEEAQRSHWSELRHMEDEKEQLSERLESASYRYMFSEKKLDRFKSAQVAKMEARAKIAPKSDTNEGNNEVQSSKGETDANGATEDTALVSESSRKQAVVVGEKRAEQLEQATEENKRLNEELNAIKLKLSSISEEDLFNSEVFKSFKSQYEDLVSRLNDYEATNTQLRSELKQLQGERLASREQADTEIRTHTIEQEAQIARLDSDLARIRHLRDELYAEVSVRKECETKDEAAREQHRDLIAAHESRIATLEAEVERLRIGKASSVSDATPDAVDQDINTLKDKLNTAEKDKRLLEKELSSMETAWRKTLAAANKKIEAVENAEEKIGKYAAEKAKADQKYFAAMKAKEALQAEVKAQKNQGSKASEIVTQLKNAEASARSMAAATERQLADLRETVGQITNQHRSLQTKFDQQKASNDQTNSRLTTMQEMVDGKEASLQEAKKSQRQAETTTEELKVQLEQTEKNLETWRKKGLGNSTEEYEVLRTIALCTICRKDFKNTALKTCGHVFCQECVDRQLQIRSRKCPNCSRAFGNSDLLRVDLPGVSHLAKAEALSINSKALQVSIRAFRGSVAIA